MKPRYSTADPTRLTGYAVAWPGDHAPGQQPVWFSGSTLAPDLSLPRLQRQWAEVHQASQDLRQPHQGGPLPQLSWPGVIAAVTATTTALSTSTVGADPTRLMQATAVLLTSVARAVEGSRGGQLTRAGTRLSSSLDRTPPSAPSWSDAERRLLALAQVVRASGRRPTAGEAAQLISAFRDLLRVSGSHSSRPNTISRLVTEATIADLGNHISVLAPTAEHATCRRRPINRSIMKTGSHDF